MIHHYIITFPYNTWNTAAQEFTIDKDFEEFITYILQTRDTFDVYETPLNISMWKELHNIGCKKYNE